MAACAVNLKGLLVVAHYGYTPADDSEGWGDETVLTGLFVLGGDETVDDGPDKDILNVIGTKERSYIESCCRADALKTIRLGEEV